MAAKQEVTLVIRARDLTRGIFRRIGASIRRLRLGLGSLVAGGGFAALTRGALDFATAVDGASQRLDVSAETLQGLKVLAEDLNIPFETLQGVIQRISRNAGQALAGDSRMLENFQQLGISLEELDRLNTEDLFFAIADAAADTSRSWRETSALLAKVGDTEAVRLRGLLVQGGDALARGVNALQDAGRIQTGEDIRKAAEAEAQLRREFIQAQKEFAKTMLVVLPAVTALVEALNKSALPLIREGQETGGFGAGPAIFDLVSKATGRGFVPGTINDPAVKAAMLRTAAATEKTAAAVQQSGVLR